MPPQAAVHIKGAGVIAAAAVVTPVLICRLVTKVLIPCAGRIGHKPEAETAEGFHLYVVIYGM